MGALVARVVRQKYGADRGRRVADLARRRVYIVAGIAGAAGRHYPQRRGAHRVLARRSNVVAALLPVSAEPLIRRWRQRHYFRRTARWLLALMLPYALYYVADPMDGMGHRLLWSQLPASIGPVLGRDTKSFVHLAVALVVCVVGTAAAELCVRKRELHIR